MPGQRANRLAERAFNGICQMDGINFINLMQSARINLQLPVKMQLILHLRISHAPCSLSLPTLRETLGIIHSLLSFFPAYLFASTLWKFWHSVDTRRRLLLFALASSFSLSVVLYIRVYAACCLVVCSAHGCSDGWWLMAAHGCHSAWSVLPCWQYKLHFVALPSSSFSSCSSIHRGRMMKLLSVCYDCE